MQHDRGHLREAAARLYEALDGGDPASARLRVLRARCCEARRGNPLDRSAHKRLTDSETKTLIAALKSCATQNRGLPMGQTVPCPRSGDRVSHLNPLNASHPQSLQ